MKLHDFSAPPESIQRLRDLGKALTQAAPLRVSEVAKKPMVAAPVEGDLDGDGDVDKMDAAIAALTADHKMVKSKIKNYD